MFGIEYIVYSCYAAYLMSKNDWKIKKVSLQISPLIGSTQ